MDHPNVDAALQRAGMASPSSDVLERLTFACQHLEEGPEAILEVSQAHWANEDQGTDVLVVETRTGMLLIGKGKRGLFKPVETFAIRAPFDYYRDLAEDDELAGASVFFLENPGHKPFLLSFRDADERHRMFCCLFEAHRGNFSRWGLQLDPANYVADFDRYYAEIVASGPNDATELRDWIRETYGEFDLTNALGLAESWRHAELWDQASPERGHRVSMMAGGDSWWRADSQPESRRAVVKLCARLYDAGLLAPPYDERTFTDDPLSRHDAGPKRLLALMTLAAFAHELRDPRASEWIQAARAGIPAVPADVFPDKLRELWSGIQPLPAVDDGPPPEIPIWEDKDVREITTRDEERSHIVYSMDMLSPADKALVSGFLQTVGAAQQSEPPDTAAVIHACLTGVSAFEGLSSLAPAGWRKFILYVVSDLTYDLWHKHSQADPSAKLAHWVVATIEANGWGPDGRSTPLGQHHSYAMGVAVDSGVGVIQFDATTGEAKAPTGDEARQAAAVGSF